MEDVRNKRRTHYRNVLIRCCGLQWVNFKANTSRPQQKNLSDQFQKPKLPIQHMENSILTVLITSPKTFIFLELFHLLTMISFINWLCIGFTCIVRVPVLAKGSKVIDNEITLRDFQIDCLPSIRNQKLISFQVEILIELDERFAGHPPNANLHRFVTIN